MATSVDSDHTPDVVDVDVPPADHTARIVNTAALRRQRIARGGRAQDRLRGKGLEYVPHETAFGAAALRRRRQMAARGLFGCFACNEPKPATRLSIVNGGARVCDDCLIAAGLVPSLTTPAIAGPHDHEVDQWEGEGGR